MEITSVAALSTTDPFVEMLDAVDRAVNRASTGHEFLSCLHDWGFMVVPIPPAAVEPIEPPPMIEPAPDPMAIDPRFSTATSMSYTFGDWLAIFRGCGETAALQSVVSDSELHDRYASGLTPHAAIDDNIPF